ARGRCAARVAATGNSRGSGACRWGPLPSRASRRDRWLRTCVGPAARASRQIRQGSAPHREPRIDLVKKSESVNNPPSWRSTVTTIRNNPHRRKALALAIALSFAGAANAQSTTGSIYGVASEGATVTVRNDSGLTRTVTADASGRYNIGTLPVGNYRVVVERNGEVVGASVVTVRAGAGADATMAAGGDPAMLEAVTVTASSVPTIDITAVDTRSVVTAEQLTRLPLARNAEAVALLAPGAVSGAAGFFGGLVSF